MKTVNVKYAEGGKIQTVSENSLFFEQENESLTVSAELPEAFDSYSIRVYSRDAKNNSYVSGKIEKSADGKYNVTISSEYMSKGTLYIGYELYNSDGYAERLEPLKIYIDSWVTLGNTSSGNVYVVTVNVGSVETLEAGSDATVTNSGTEKDMILNFGIPKGEKGDKGDTGDKGDKGDKGDRGEKGEPFVYSDFTVEQLALLKGEKGDKGDTGAKGEQGEKGAAFVYSDFTAEQLALLKGEKGDKGDTGAKGEQGEKGAAFVYSDFTAEQLALLKGEKGDKGDTGAKGEQGIQGVKGDSGYTPVRGTDYWTEEDKSEVESDVKEYTSDIFANALKGTNNGAFIMIDDISPAKHEMTVRLVSKNLIPYPYNDSSVTERNGITFTNNSDGTITANGTATANTFYGICGSLGRFNGVLQPNKKYCISCGLEKTSNYYMRLKVNDTWYVTDTAFETPSQITYAEAELRIAAGTTLDNVVFKPQLEYGEEFTDYTPYFSGLTSAAVIYSGKNLIPFENIENLTWAKTIANSSTGIGSDLLNILNSLKTGTTYTLSYSIKLKSEGEAFSTTDLGGFIIKCGGTTIAEPFTWGDVDAGTTVRKSISFTFTDEKKQAGGFTNIWAYGCGNMTVGATGSAQMFDVQLEVGNTATEYEEYAGSICTPSADGVVAGVKSLYPITTLLTNNSGAVITAEYNRDINKAFSELEEKLTNAILSTGGNV